MLIRAKWVEDIVCVHACPYFTTTIWVCILYGNAQMHPRAELIIIFCSSHEGLHSFVLLWRFHALQLFLCYCYCYCSFVIHLYFTVAAAAAETYATHSWPLPTRTTFALAALHCCIFIAVTAVIAIVAICLGSEIFKHISKTCQCVTFHIYLIN